MNSKTQLSTSVEIVTPETAKAYLSLNGINRPIKRPIVAFYSDLIRRGQWKENGESICFTSDGKLADGQHRLSAIVESGMPVRCVVVRGCEDGSFATYDSGVNRTISDTFATAGIKNYAKISAIVNRHFAISKRQAFMRSSASEAVGYSAKRSKVSREDLLKKYLSLARTYDLVQKDAAFCVRRIRIFSEAEIGGIMAYLEIDCEYPRSLVYDFFSNIHDLKKSGTTAEFALRATLLRDAQKKTGGLSSSYKQNLLIKAWNAFATCQKIKTLRYDTERERKVWFLSCAEAEKINAERKDGALFKS